MGSGGVWHLAARYPERWRAIAPLSGPFVNRSSYPFERLRALPIFMTEGRGATPSLEGSRAMAAFLREQAFDVDYLETGGDHGGMVSEVLPAIFDFFDRHR
jgi:pimeloyl-ACP methyl ester carboxylesterase